MPESGDQDPGAEEFVRSVTDQDTSEAERPTGATVISFAEKLAELRARDDVKSRADLQILEQVGEWFVYHPPRPDQLPRYLRLRDAAGLFALQIVEDCPGSADRTTALRKVREAVMTANASIALEPPPVDPAP